MVEKTDNTPVLGPGGVTLQTFVPHATEAFSVPVEGGAVPLTLARVTDLGWSVPGGRQAFSLQFSGPPAPVLPQRIYRLEHAAFVLDEIFLVPLGPEAGVMRYEAIFT